MENKDYFQKVQELFRKVEDKLVELEEDTDYDTTNDKIEVSFEKGGSKIVINTQRAIHEIWLAGNARGWHFKYMEDKKVWFAESEQEEFYQCLAKLLESRLGYAVSFGG